MLACDALQPALMMDVGKSWTLNRVPYETRESNQPGGPQIDIWAARRFGAPGPGGDTRQAHNGCGGQPEGQNKAPDTKGHGNVLLERSLSSRAPRITGDGMIILPVAGAGNGRTPAKRCSIATERPFAGVTVSCSGLQSGDGARALVSGAPAA